MTAVLLIFAGVAVGPSSVADSFQRALTGGDTFALDNLKVYNNIGRLNEFAAAGSGGFVAYIGGSTMRESVTSEVGLSREIAEAGGESLSVFDLTSAGQDLIVSWGIAELAACNGAAIIVLGLNPLRWGNVGDNHPIEEIGYLGNEVAEFVNAGHFQARLKGNGIGLLADARARLSITFEVINAALTGRRTVTAAGWRDRGDHRYFSVSQKRPIPQSLAEANRRAVPPTGAAIDMVKHIATTVARCGSKLFVVLSAAHPDLSDSERFPGFAAALAKQPDLLVKAGVTPDAVIDLSRLSIGEEHFHDWAHIRTLEAVERTSLEIAGSLARFRAVKLP